MHRSGTSALTRTLNFLGAALPCHVLPPGIGNEAGHWEPEPAVRLHDRLLEAAGTSVNDLAGPSEAWCQTAAADGFVDQMANLIVSEFGDHPLFVFKDPRSSLVFPLWRRALARLGIRCLPVIIARNPVEVALSLGARQATAAPGQSWSLDRGGWLWLRYSLAAERDTRGEVRSFCLYSEVLDDWRSVARRLARDFDLSWPRPVAEAERDVDGFLAARLRHHREPDEVAARSGIWSSLIAPVYDALRDAAAGHPPASSVFDAIGRSFDEACAVVRSADAQPGPVVRAPAVAGAASTRARPAGRPRVCVVGTGFLVPGEATPHLRRILDDAVAAGFDVTLVLPGDVRADAGPEAPAAPPGAELQSCVPAVPPIEPGYMRTTAALLRHLRAQRFDAILFQDQEGLGFASITAKQAGLAFAETVLGVVASGPSRWRREADGRFPADLVTIATEYLEQRAAELADLVILPSEPVAAWMQQAGWRFRMTLPWQQPAEGTPSGVNVWAEVIRQTPPGGRPSPTARTSGPDDVTVVITSYERPRLLDQNLEALTHQTDKDFSVLVVDDGSRSAEALEYLAGVEAQYRALNLRLIRQDNRYLGAARNTGIRAADTEFVILLDDDNVPFPDMVSTLRRAIDHAEADAVTCGVRCFHDSSGTPPLDPNEGGPDQLFSAGPLLLGAVHNCFGDASGIYRSSVFEKVGYFHELKGRVFEDWQLLLKVAAAGLRLLSVPEPLVWYRVRPDSLLRTTRRYDNARVIAETIDGMPCSALAGLADFLMGSEAEMVRLNAEIERRAADCHREREVLRTAAAINTLSLNEAGEEARRHARSLQEALDARTKSAEEAARYARSLEQVIAELRVSNATAAEYAASLERARAEAETYAKHLEVEYRRLETEYRKLLDAR
jgi:GT2 family glycosyltransferase